MQEFVFTEGDTKSFDVAVTEAMQTPIKHYEKELAGIRTGRASTALLDNIRVECYGQLMPLNELATLAAPDARLITIQPWDKTIIGDIDRAINDSDLGITPINDGTIVRLQLPQMSESRRSDLVKVLGKKTEECRIGIRNIRKEFHNQVRDELKKKKNLSEDFAKRLNDTLQKVTDNHISKVEEMNKKKEHDIRLV